MSILNDSAYYLEAYEEFTSRYDKPIEDLTELVFVKSVVEKIKTKDTKIRMLGIGSSSGRIEIMFIKRLLNRFPTIENTVVEPSAKAIAEYQSSIKGMWKNVEFSWFNGTFQKFRVQLESAGNNQTFHHINLVDSIYYVDKLKEDIVFMYDRLEQGGIMLIAVESDQGSMYKIKQRYPNLSSEINLVSSTEVIDVCKAHQIPFHLHRHECYVDITELFSSKSITRNEQLLLDFWVQMKNFKENVPESLYEEVIAFIKSPACSEKLEGKLRFRGDTDMIFIQKYV
ncbi:histamine N-methyltransferase A-like isoform X2 [Anneissia japonica]|uniref:histamine N-methyltransferase A-like isoform X2 n=1 Tax=Anneissia japonica TaxID=1529436 RepID=UPI001425AEA4|nr:histamine N-methyltransferase A-like isoform X2 [Anneissia japonica]